jgi:hypothetical protein
MSARGEIDRYKNGAILVENFKVLLQGGLTRRPGTRYVATVKYPTRLTLVKPFEPSTSDAYILEVGHEYMRFYKNGARIDVASVPVEVATPYQESDLRLLRTAQSNDVMILVHPSYAPQRLSRLSDTAWDFRPVPLYPMPTYEAGIEGPFTLTLGATTGNGVAVTSSGAFWLIADIDRVLSSGIGRGIIRTATSPTNATIDIIDPFSATTLAAGEWKLERSPVAQLQVNKTGPVGGTIAVTLLQQQDAATNLLSNGDFGSGDLTGWVNASRGNFLTGNHDGGGNNPDLQDASQDFVNAGVRPTQTVYNDTDGSTGVIATVSTRFLVIGAPGMVGGAENDFDSGDAYTIAGTGGASVAGGMALLTGGTAGVGWISQGVATTVGLTYRVAFRVSEAQVSAQVGSTAEGSDVKAEASYAIGDQSFSFTATGPTSYLQFRNNQDAVGRVGAITCRVYSVQGFRATEVGQYIRVHGGLVRLTGYVNATHMTGQIVKELSSDDVAAAGAWSLERDAWSDALGWPSAVVLYEGRLDFAGTAHFPQTIWGSVIDDLFNFATGPNADDALEMALVDSGGNITLNRIRWLMPAENMLVGTTHGEYRLIGSGDDPLSPATPPRNRIQSTFGSDTVQPLKVGASLLFAQRQGSKLREMSYDERTQTTYIARDLLITSDHLLKRYRLLELAYEPEPVPVVWGVRSDGQMLGITYDQGEQVVAPWRFVTAGAVESVAAIPHPTANAHQVWMVCQRTLGGRETRCIEYLDPEARMVLPTPVEMGNELTQETETITGWEGLTVDCAKVYTDVNTATLTGLEHLDGAEVQIVGDGAVLPVQTVTGGQVVLSRAVQTAFVGLAYTPRGRTMPVDVTVRGQTGQGLRKRWASLRARVQQTACLVLQGERMPFRLPTMPMNQGPAPFTGDREVMALGFDRYGFIGFEADQPLPVTIIAIMGTIDTEVHQ